MTTVLILQGKREVDKIEVKQFASHYDAVDFAHSMNIDYQKGTKYRKFATIVFNGSSIDLDDI